MWNPNDHPDLSTSEDESDVQEARAAIQQNNHDSAQETPAGDIGRTNSPHVPHAGVITASPDTFIIAFTALFTPCVCFLLHHMISSSISPTIRTQDSKELDQERGIDSPGNGEIGLHLVLFPLSMLLCFLCTWCILGLGIDIQEAEQPPRGNINYPESEEREQMHDTGAP
ncbi:hypothetical protein [Neorickettsia findlayensis]|uniref:Uncharacterized protein n=1 Tax=Neorickettsia findlayensis TaxID=2686014 RepID=A0A6P1GAV3_9RICK|nr:hypothetical protein [Neorickettsia findlayensis]QHD65333.1 hypothetical protein GP480_02655 [Neorickettsia findlayensis]